MAITTKAGLGLLGIVVLVVAGFGLWYFTMRNWAAPYQETNASWRIHGVCTNAQNGAPIKGAQVTASFQEVITFKHHWRNPPALATANVVPKTDDQGRFEVAGQGGSAYNNIINYWTGNLYNNLFYVTGRVPDPNDPVSLDRKLVTQYGTDVYVSKWTQARGKKTGRARVQYLRYGRFFVMLATHGEHPFFAAEGKQVRDLRRHRGERPGAHAPWIAGLVAERSEGHPGPPQMRAGTVREYAGLIV